MNTENNIVKRKDTLFLAASFVIVFALFFILELFQPFINDDTMYAFICGEEPLKPVQSLSDAIRSQIYEYHHTNGRFIVHVLVQLFCGLKLITFYRMLSSFMFAMLWLGLVKLIRQKYGFFKSDSIVILFALLIGIPKIGTAFLSNIACGINYLWTSAIIIWLLVLFQHIKANTAKRPIWVNMLIFAAGLFSCALQESFSIPLAAGMFIYFCFNRQAFRGSMRYLFFGVALGTCLVSIAPANFIRAANMHTSQSSVSFIKLLSLNTYRVLECLIIFEIFILCTIVSLIKSKKKYVQFIKEHILLVAANAVSFTFMMFVAFTGEQQASCIELFSLILLYSMFRTYHPSWYISKHRVVAWVCLLGFVITYSYAYTCRQNAASAYNELWTNAVNSKDGYAVGKDYINCYMEGNYFSRRFTRVECLAAKGITAAYDKKWISAIITNGQDTSLIRCVLPLSRHEIIQGCNSENEVSECVYWLPQIKMNVVRFPAGRKNSDIRVWFRRPMIVYILDRLRNRQGWTEIIVDDVNGYDNFEADGFRYYIINSGDYCTPVMKVEVEP